MHIFGIVPLNRTFLPRFRGTIFFHLLFISDYLHIKINTKSHFGAITPLNRTFLPRFRGLIVSLRRFSGLSVAVNMHTDADSESNRQALHVRAVRQLLLKTNAINHSEIPDILHCCHYCGAGLLFCGKNLNYL